MSGERLRVLFLCTGNSARSILGEYLLRHFGGTRFEVVSAGAEPTGRVHPLALTVLRERYAIDARDARSQSWEEFAAAGIDLVITVCDHARDSCPLWPGDVLRAHWGSPDPAAAAGDEDQIRAVFERVAEQIERRVRRLCALPVAELSRDELETALRAIGEDGPEP